MNTPTPPTSGPHEFKLATYTEGPRGPNFPPHPVPTATPGGMTGEDMTGFPNGKIVIYNKDGIKKESFSPDYFKVIRQDFPPTPEA